MVQAERTDRRGTDGEILAQWARVKGRLKSEFGEATYGLGRGVAHFAYVSIGTGTGMGIVIDGKLYRGARGCAGGAVRDAWART